MDCCELEGLDVDRPNVDVDVDGSDAAVNGIDERHEDVVRCSDLEE